MADLAASIETLENRLMRAWIQGDRRMLKKLSSRNFNMLIAGRTSLGLDRASWLDACGSRLTCSGYRLADVYVRKHGYSAFFASRCELDLQLDGEDWSGQFWLTDLWRRSQMTMKWQLAERTLSRTDTSDKLPGAVRALQLWR